MLTEQTDLDSGLRGFWFVLAGHLGHARLANRMIYWLRRSSPTRLAQNDPAFRVSRHALGEPWKTAEIIPAVPQ